jgi:ubiquinone/menaquinone biosynthesis C-methylase UbiE
MVMIIIKSLEHMKTLWDRKWEKFKNDKASHSNLEPVTRAIIRIMKGYIPADTKTIIETGCGTGRICFALARTFPKARITGTDVSRGSIALCNKGKKRKKMNNANFKRMDIIKLGFPDGRFDVALCEGVLQHIPSDIAGLREMVRVTKPGGLVFSSVVNLQCLPHTIYKTIKGKRYEHYPERSYTHETLKKLFKKAGLKKIEIRGVYPGYGMQRIEGYLPLLGPIITQILYLSAFVVDKFTNNWFSDQFGIQLVAKGTK